MLPSASIFFFTSFARPVAIPKASRRPIFKVIMVRFLLWVLSLNMTRMKETVWFIWLQLTMILLIHANLGEKKNIPLFFFWANEFVFTYLFEFAHPFQVVTICAVELRLKFRNHIIWNLKKCPYTGNATAPMFSSLNCWAFPKYCVNIYYCHWQKIVVAHNSSQICCPHRKDVLDASEQLPVRPSVMR